MFLHLNVIHILYRELLILLYYFKGSIGDLHDVLELFRQHVLSKNYKDIETVDDTGKQCLRRQKLRRY
jgi:hypothetical protein